MTLYFGVLRTREELEGAETVAVGAPSPAAGDPRSKFSRAELRSRTRLDSELRAKQIVIEAEQRAAELLARAEQELASLRARVTDEARKEGATALSAALLRFAAKEAATEERSLERSIELARLLAERLLGEALTLDPSRIVGLARTSLAEARGARRITLVAHPEDAPTLQAAVDAGQLEHIAKVLASPEIARGALRIESEIGVLDAEIAPQLDRLVARLREPG